MHFVWEFEWLKIDLLDQNIAHYSDESQNNKYVFGQRRILCFIGETSE